MASKRDPSHIPLSGPRAPEPRPEGYKPPLPLAPPPSPLDAHRDIAALRDRTRAVCEDADFMAIACAHVSNGGSLIGLADALNVRYGDLYGHIVRDKARNEAYLAALAAREEWEKEYIMSDLRARAAFDIRKLYGDDGQLRPLSEWPADAARFVEEITTDDLFEGHGKEREKVGETRKVKLESRVKNKELLMRARAMLVERKEITVGLRLEDIMAAAHDLAPAPVIDAEVVTPTPPTPGLTAAPPLASPSSDIPHLRSDLKSDPPPHAP